MKRFSITLQKVSTTFADITIEASTVEEANIILKNSLENPMNFQWGESEVYVDLPDVITKIE